MKRFFITLVLVLIGTTWGAKTFIGKLIVDGISAAGTAALGVPFSCQSITVGLLAGQLDIGGIEVSGPQGFKTVKCVRIEDVGVDCKITSLLSDVITLDEIHVQRPEITLEIGKGGSNLGHFLKRLESRREKRAHEPRRARADREPDEKRQFLVERIVIEEAQVHVSADAFLKADLTFTLPTITLEDIGNTGANGERQPVDFAGILEQVFGAISASASTRAGLPTDLGNVLSGETIDLDGLKSIFKGSKHKKR